MEGKLGACLDLRVIQGQWRDHPCLLLGSAVWHLVHRNDPGMIPGYRVGLAMATETSFLCSLAARSQALLEIRQVSRRTGRC